MFYEVLFLWFKFFLFLIPILFAGMIIFRRFCSIDRFELLVPAGSVFGITLFIFLINTISFFVKGPLGVNLAYFFLILLLPFLYFKKVKQPKILFPSRKILMLWSLSFLAWGWLIFWKGNYALIGSDTNLYYSVAHLFLKGNSPPATPWQPDLPLSYHLGAFELLGAFYSFTNLSFQFLHIFFACFFIFCTSQIIVWIWRGHDTFLSFIWGNLASAIALISFGFFKVVIPAFPVRLPDISNPHELFLWIRNLPTVIQTIEVYGAPINLDALIYFIFHSFGLAVVLSLTLVILYLKAGKSRLGWIVLLVGLTSLAIINESIFIVSAPALIFGAILTELQNKTFTKNIKYIAILLVVFSFLTATSGGIITTALFPSNSLEKSVLIFPSKFDIKEDFISYHHNQQISKIIPQAQERYPFYWLHIGVDLLLVASTVTYLFTKFSKQQKILLHILYLMGILSLMFYNFIVPKYLIANGNRFLAFAFISFSLFLTFAPQNLLENPPKRYWIKYFFIAVLLMFILMPSILPPLTLLTKTRFGESKLIPRKEQTTNAIEWIKNNLLYNRRVVVLDARTPHPSGMARVLVQAGVFAPIFPDKFKAYTIEASPQYIDIAYYLSPKALRELKVDTLLIDSKYYENADKSIKEKLDNEKYFKILSYSQNLDNNWEKVLKVEPQYYDLGELGTTFDQLSNLPISGSIYIDNEENFSPSFLRRPLIFTLRNRDLYFLPQSGVYLNVEASINSQSPRDDGDYDYLILGRFTNPKDICGCQIKLLWKGIKDEVFVWEKM